MTAFLNGWKTGKLDRVHNADYRLFRIGLCWCQGPAQARKGWHYAHAHAWHGRAYIWLTMANLALRARACMAHMIMAGWVPGAVAVLVALGAG